MTKEKPEFKDEWSLYDCIKYGVGLKGRVKKLESYTEIYDRRRKQLINDLFSLIDSGQVDMVDDNGELAKYPDFREMHTEDLIKLYRDALEDIANDLSSKGIRMKKGDSDEDN